MHIDIIKSVLILLGAMVYNIFSGTSSILIARNFIKLGAILNGIYQIISVFIFSMILADVKTESYLLVPMSLGYMLGILISGRVVEKLQLGEVHIHAFMKPDDAMNISLELKERFGIYSTAMRGIGVQGESIDLVVATSKKELSFTINAINNVAKDYNIKPKISFVEANNFWKK